MRIAVFIKATTLHQNYGGLETFNRVLCEGLVKRGHDVVVYSPKRELKKTESVDNGVKYIFIDCVFRYLLSDLDKNSWIQKSYEVFKQNHSQNKFDIVIGQSSGALGIIEHKNELNIKVISISHGSILSEYLTAVKHVAGIKDVFRLALNTQYVFRAYFGSQRAFIRNSNKVIAVSNAVKKSVIDETFIPEEKVQVILNGIDNKSFSKFSRKQNKYVNIIFVGRVIRSKGVFDLINIIKDEKFANSVLNIIGEGDDLPQIKSLSEKYNLTSRVNYFGWLNREEVVQKLFENDIFVLPTLRVEGFPMTLVEAMFAGLPIVASDIGGIADAVESMNTGYLVKPGDTEQFKVKLLELVNNKALREEFSYNALEKANREFTLDIMLDKYENVMKEVLK